MEKSMKKVRFYYLKSPSQKNNCQVRKFISKAFMFKRIRLISYIYKGGSKL